MILLKIYLNSNKIYTLHEPQINTTKHPSDQSFLLLAKSSNHILYNPS